MPAYQSKGHYTQRNSDILFRPGVSSGSYEEESLVEKVKRVRQELETEHEVIFYFNEITVIVKNNGSSSTINVFLESDPEFWELRTMEIKYSEYYDEWTKRAFVKEVEEKLAAMELI